MNRVIRPIGLEVDEESLLKDLGRYREEALRLGASDAKVIPASQAVFDERVGLKCRVPLCFGFGTSANCPPHAVRPEALREAVRKYRYALLFKLEVPAPVIARNRETILERAGAYKKVFELTSALESAAFYDGHYLAAGFAAGSCKSTYCHKLECAVLRGERCLSELWSRPSMEAVGMDVYRMAASVGWDIYPIGSGCSPEEIPQGSLVGIVFIR